MSSAVAGATPRLLRSLFGGGLLYFALFVLVHALLAFSTSGSSWNDAVCLLLIALPQLSVILRRSVDLSNAATAVFFVALVVAAVVGLAGLVRVPGDGAYSAWYLGAITFDLLGLTLLGRFRAAWLTMATMVVLALGWALLHGLPATDGAMLVVRHVATLAVGTALAVALRRSNAATAGFQLVQRRRRQEEDVASARAGARRNGVERVLEEAGPMLRAIADGRDFTEEDRLQMLVIEGRLRDQIRTPGLAIGPLRESLDAARRRGVDVLLLDEADPSRTAARDRSAAWLAARLDATERGGFVGRARPGPYGGIRVSAVTDDRGEAVTFD